MEWPPEFHAWRAYLTKAGIQRGLSIVTHIVPRYADDPRPGWPFPFPEDDPPAMPAERLDADVAALARALERC